MFRSLLRLFGFGRAEPPPEAGADIAPAPAAPLFEPQNELEELLVAAAHDPQRRAAFNRLLLESTLYAVSPDLPASRGMALPAAAGPLRLIEVSVGGGPSLPALFTSQQRLFAQFGNGMGFFAADGARMIGLIAGHGAWLNPGIGYGVCWTAADCALLLGRPAERRREEDAQLLLGAPSEPPEALIAALRGALAGDPAIESVWLALAQWPGREGLRWYLDVRTYLARELIEQRLEPVFRGADLGGHALDLVVIEPGGEGAGLCLLGGEDGARG